MQYRKWLLSFAAIACLIASPFSIHAQQPAANGGQQVVAVTAPRPLAELLPDKLAGVKATGEVRQFTADNLAELVGDEATFYREYYVTRAASRQYGPIRIDVFESSHPFGAFGLVTFYGSPAHPLVKTTMEGTARGNYFVRVITANGELRGLYSLTAKPPDTSVFKPYRAVIEKLTPIKPDERPVILRSLPEASRASSYAGYYLGPESLNTAVAGTRDLYAFNGDAEAVVAEYKINKPTDTNDPTTKPATKQTAAAPPVEPMKLVIVEYHTPQFAYDAINRANEYVNSLPEAEQQRIIIKREGNYIVEAVNFNDRNAAQAIVDAVQYPYGVQWLHHPSIPSPDPFRVQKAAQMLVSTFGLLGILLGTVLVCGSIFGTTMFLKRRKRMQAAFSDAGQMLRLELNPFEKAILGLPPKRE
jgi:hypothetical protein